MTRYWLTIRMTWGDKEVGSLRLPLVVWVALTVALLLLAVRP